MNFICILSEYSLNISIIFRDEILMLATAAQLLQVSHETKLGPCSAMCELVAFDTWGREFEVLR